MPAAILQPRQNSTTTALFLFLLLLLHYAAAAQNPDTQPLLHFKSTADPDNAVLTSWNASSDPCTAAWLGVTCLHNRVSGLVVENLHLRGVFPLTLTSLTELRLLSLKNNNFSGQIPDLSNLTDLKLLFISHNNFSGDFPLSLTSISNLYRLDLSFNKFTGNIPSSANRLTSLLTLKLEGNGFSGSLPGLNLQNLQDFNVSGNALTGKIPDSLSRFPATSFWNNRFLCGPPLGTCTAVSSNPTTIASSPAGIPTDTKPPITKSGNTNTDAHRGNKFSLVAMIGIVVGDVVALGLVSMMLYCYFWRNYSGKLGSGKKSGSAEKMVYSSSPVEERGKIVFFEGVRRFELEDLLRASAEMLGKGGFGTAYKAILDDGNVVAVKRLKELGVNGKKEFEQQMEVLGRLKHPNLVELRAYYFAKDEKLLVYDYMPNANLFWLLHGNRGPGRTPLDWTTRLKIASDAARGLAFIHSSCKAPIKLVHGNIKSTNILIDKDGNARLSDFGLSPLASSRSSILTSNPYRAPEASLDGRKLTQKADIYSFGVFLLELLTGKCPSVSGGGSSPGGVVDLPRWVQSVVREEWTAEVFDIELMMYKGIEEEMVGLLQIGMACAQPSPDHRPKINFVVKMIDELRGAEASPSPDVSVSDECK